MSKDTPKSRNYSSFRNSFSFGNFERLSKEKNIDNNTEEKENVEIKENKVDIDKKLKIPKKKQSHLHSKKSFSISVSTDEFNYWKRVAKMNKKNVSSLIRDIVNEHTGYENTKE